MRNEHETTDILRRSAEVRIEPAAEDGGPMRVLMVSRTGNVVRRRGWDSDQERFVDFDEELVPDGGRAMGHVPFLDSHRRGSVADIIGSVREGSIRVTDDGLEAEVDLDNSDPRANKVRAGHARNSSVGYEPTRYEWKRDEGQAPRMIIHEWALRELSAVPVGADAGAMFRCRGVPTEHEEGPMPATETEIETRGLSAADALRLRGFATELGVSIDDATLAGCESYERGAALILDVRHAEQIKRPGPSGVVGGEDESDKSRKRLASEIYTGIATSAEGREAARKGGVDWKRSALWSEQCDGVGLRHVLTQACKTYGVRLEPGVSERQMLADLMTRSGPHSTSDFPSLLADVMHNTLAPMEQAAPPTYQEWARARTYSDFRPHRTTRLSEDEGLLKVLEGEEIEYGSVVDEGEATKAEKYGRGYDLSLEAIVNDSLGGFATLGQRIEERWRQRRNALAYGVLLSNPVLEDGTAFFDSSRGNLVAGADAGLPTVASMESLRLKLINRKNKKGQPIRLQLGSWLSSEVLAYDIERILGITIQTVSPATTAGGAGNAATPRLRAGVIADNEIDLGHASGKNFWFAVAANGSPFVHGRVVGVPDWNGMYAEWIRERGVLRMVFRDTFGFGPDDPNHMVWNTGIDIT